jgi:glycolate oxidase
MNAPTTPSQNDLMQRSERQAQIVRALQTHLPAHALLWQSEDTTPYECDGLTAYRQRPLVVALPETEAQVQACSRPATRWACRWWRAAPAPACRAARCRTRWA